MQELQPKIKELQKKYGKDRQRLTQETMELYQQHGVNPMAGCLPMLIQIPIFFGLYQAIDSLSDGSRHRLSGASSFLWLHSLADADPCTSCRSWPAVFQFVQTRMMRPAKQGKITDPQQAMMNTMMNFMPLTVIFFGWGFASGPVLYWATQSVYSVVQQWFITGWGSLRDWVAVAAGDAGAPPPRLSPAARPRRSGRGQRRRGAPAAGGVMGWIQRRMEEKPPSD